MPGGFWTGYSGCCDLVRPGRICRALWSAHPMLQSFPALDKADAWDRIMNAIPYYEGDVRMIDGPSVRVPHCAATLKSPDRNIGRSR